MSTTEAKSGSGKFGEKYNLSTHMFETRWEDNVFSLNLPFNADQIVMNKGEASELRKHLNAFLGDGQ